MRPTLAARTAPEHDDAVSRGPAFVVFGLVAGAACLGCGPSVQSIYEGNVRFEHCYRLDLDLDIAATHRETCWKQWLKSYTYGQPRDRIEYARRRVRAFASGDPGRPLLNLGEHRPETRQFYLVVPAPTSIHAPPPPIATQVQPSAPPAASADLPDASAPAAGCASECERAWRSCQAACGPDGGASEPACRSCEPDYKNCMKRCYE